jgi:hypothetical protein
LSRLACFLELQVLNQVYPDCEALDGILSLVARKTGRLEAEILGLCILLSDQSVTPLHVRLQIGIYNDEITWLECRLGERGNHGMVRTPYDSSSAVAKRLYALEGKADSIDWVYKVTFGQRRA